MSHGNYDLYIPVDSKKSVGYIGHGTAFPLGPNVYEVPVENVRDLSIDCILFQSPQNYLKDQFEIFSDEHRALPKIYLEHDPPQEHPTNTRHVVADPLVTIVHVTHFNNMMWDNNGVPTHVIDHGIVSSALAYQVT